MITPAAGYQTDPNNPNGVVPSNTASQYVGPSTTPTPPPATDAPTMNGYYTTGAQSGQLVNQPAATAPTTPAPSPSTPAAPGATTPPAGTTPTGGGTTPPAGTATTPTQPTSPALAFNGSIVDLFNAAGEDSSLANRTKMAQQYGIQGYTGNTAQQQKELADKFIAAHNATKGTDAPQTAADAASQLDQHFNDNQKAPTEDPEKAFFDQYASMNPAVKSLYDQINSVLSPSTTQQTFEQEYNKAFTDTANPAGTPGESLSQEQLKLMNINNIMDGSEDDIRTEVEKAGGFATDSQVMALTGARNKTLLKQANQLQQSMTLKQDYVNNLMNFSQLDRAAVEKQVDQKLGLTSQLVDLGDKINNAAKDNFKNIVTAGGYSALAAAYANDPKGKANAEKLMGLPQGALSSPAFLKATTTSDLKPLQFVSGTENQASGTFDPNTGTFTPRSGGGGGSGGTTPGNSSGLSGVVSTILGSGAFTKQQAAMITNAINSGEDPSTVIKNQAKNIMGTSEATTLTKYEASQSAMQQLKNSMNQYYSAGGNTNLIKGSIEDMAAKIGQTQDPKLRSLATQIEAQLQIYRNAVSGTAYSVQEGQSIAGIFPGIDKSKQLNDAIFAGRDIAFQAAIDGAYKTALGSAYDKLPVGVISKDGKAGTVPQGQLNDALKEGYTRIW